MQAKTERNNIIISAVHAGESLKEVADRFHISIARVSKIVSAAPRSSPTLTDVKPTLLAMQTLLNDLLAHA